MMTSYAEMKDNLLVERAFSTVQGVPLDGGPYKRWIPIRPCICVTEPCPCDTLEDIIVWLPSNIKSDKTGRKWEGQDVLSYTLDPGSNILVETQIPMTISQLQSLKAVAERQNRKTVSVLQKSLNSKKGKKPTVGALLIGAFELGWHIGERIDEETNVSDKISDWLADNFPWPW